MGLWFWNHQTKVKLEILENWFPHISSNLTNFCCKSQWNGWVQIEFNVGGGFYGRGKDCWPGGIFLRCSQNPSLNKISYRVGRPEKDMKMLGERRADSLQYFTRQLAFWDIKNNKVIGQTLWKILLPVWPKTLTYFKDVEYALRLFTPYNSLCLMTLYA